MRRDSWLVLVAGCAVLACARPIDAPPPPPLPPPPVCTGAANLELGALSISSPERAPPGRQVMVENGSSFLYVDGTCRYWTIDPLDPWAGARTGVFTPDEKLEVLSRLEYGWWAEWSGEHVPSEAGFDTPTFVLLPGMTADGMVTCLGGCWSSPVPTELQLLARSFHELTAELSSRGEPLTGGVRLVVVREESPIPVPIPYLEWPLAEDVAGFAISEVQATMLTWGQGRAFHGADAEAFRALRAAYRASTLPGLVFHIPVKDGLGTTYRVYLRDALPYEDEAGLIRPR